MDCVYRVKKGEEGKSVRVQVPGSKSMTNRALLLAAMSHKKCRLTGVLFSDDSRAFLACLQSLGFAIEADEKKKEVILQGAGGSIPCSPALVSVGSAGTAARFLTVFLAFAGGEYEMQASPQMCRRPMQPLLSLLEEAGVSFTFLGEKDHFPFRMKSPGVHVKEVKVDTGISSQFASALLMAGALLPDGLRVRLEGDRGEGSYIKMTLVMMEQFGLKTRAFEGGIQVFPGDSFGLSEYRVEPDVSGACYFYAMAPLLKTDVIVKNVHRDSLQGDLKFLLALEQMGCELTETEEGICLSGRKLKAYRGLRLSMKDFSDQTMTMAAIAPFAAGPTVITHVGHIRFQESDRLQGILTELTKMGIACKELPEEEGLIIYPGTVEKETLVETYEDHRMAMAFTLTGLKTGKILIHNPDCCRKTFENYFELIDALTKEGDDTKDGREGGLIHGRTNQTVI